MGIETILFAIIIGILGAVVYTLRMIAKMNENIKKIMKHMGISEVK